jgi:hypothetical protein
LAASSIAHSARQLHIFKIQEQSKPAYSGFPTDQLVRNREERRDDEGRCNWASLPMT